LQGGYLDMSAFIAEQGFKTGKGGYQKVRPTCRYLGCSLCLSYRLATQDYPPLYVLRPDGSTLYTYRDVVYRCARMRWWKRRLVKRGLCSCKS